MRLVILLTIPFLFSVDAALADLILSNGGFETGDLTGWDQDTGAGVVVTVSNEMDPSAPRAGAYLFSASQTDGADRQEGNEITISQAIDVSGFAYINEGKGLISAKGFFSGALGELNPSNDTAQIIVDYFENGPAGTLLDTFHTIAIDPDVGSWNEVSIPSQTVPMATDTLVFRVRTMLDPGFESIDIGADDFSLSLTAVPEPSALALLAFAGLGIGGYRWCRHRKKP